MNRAALVALLNGDIENAVIASTSGGILQQEAEGQQKFVNSSTLPVNSPWPELEALGVKRLGKRMTEDSLFEQVELPDGWKKVPTDHSMWSDLVDGDGNKVASIFYKAAFYDERAFCRMGD